MSSGHAIEKIDEARFQRVLGADDDQAFVTLEPRDNLRRVSQCISRRADIGAHGLFDDVVSIRLAIARQRSFYGRANEFRDRTDVCRYPTFGRLQGVERRPDRAAVRMAEHHDESCTEFRTGEFHAANQGRLHDIAGNPHDEQVANALVENNLGRGAGIRAAENHGKRFLRVNVLAPPRLVADAVLRRVRDKAAITFAQALECFACPDHQPVICQQLYRYCCTLPVGVVWSSSAYDFSSKSSPSRSVSISIE